MQQDNSDDLNVVGSILYNVAGVNTLHCRTLLKINLYIVIVNKRLGKHGLGINCICENNFQRPLDNIKILNQCECRNIVQ